MLENLSGIPSYSKSYTHPEGLGTMYFYPLSTMPEDSGFIDDYDALLTRNSFIGRASDDTLIYLNSSANQAASFDTVAPEDGFDGYYFIVTVLYL